MVCPSRRRWLCLAAVSVLCCFTGAAGVQQDQPGAPFLMVWPSARTSALAGAVTALTDGADGAEWNPACAALQQTLAANVTYGPWVPGMLPGMSHFHGGAFYHLPHPAFGKVPVTVGLTATYFDLGATDVVNSAGQYLGTYPVWRGALGLLGGARLLDKLSAGVTLKLISSRWDPSGFDWEYWAFPGGGGDCGSIATTYAADIGLLYQPNHVLSAGLTAANLGPNIVYSDPTYAATVPTPRMLRVGLRYSPVDSRMLRISVMPEVSKVLVGMFYDPENSKSIAQKLEYEWWEAWKSLGVEANVADLVSLRLGYFEDITQARGGIVMTDMQGSIGSDEHISLFDAIFKSQAGKKVAGLGLTWGFGVGYHDMIRLDFASDAFIYDFPTDNWRMTLVSNNLPGLVRLMGHL